MKKLLLITIAAAALMLSSCDKTDAGKEHKPNDTQLKTESNAESIREQGDDYYFSDLSTEKYDGYEFRILVRKGQLSDQYLENDSEELVESAVYKRNRAIEERYGITITASESSKTNADTDALNSILAGDDAYDVIFPHTGSAFAYALQGSVLNLNEVETIHLDKPWWSQDIVDSFNINGYLYMIDGDITMHLLNMAMCLYFNKRIFDDLGFDYPYETVKSGEWTFDEFAYLVKKGGKDLNGNGVMEPEYDQYGFFAGDFQSPIGILYAGGQKIYDKDDEGALKLSLYSNKTIEIFDEYFSLMNNDNCFISLSEGTPNYTGSDPFVSGRAMFSDGTLGSAKSYRNMQDEFGIVPLPKFDEDDEYAAIVNGFAHTVVVPITVPDVNRTGAIIEALCAYGSKDVLPAFYEVSLKTKYARDNDSEEMIDIIKDSIVYDIGYASGGPFTFCGRTLANTTNRDFSSFYAANESVAQKHLDEFNENYGHIEKE